MDAHEVDLKDQPIGIGLQGQSNPIVITPTSVITVNVSFHDLRRAFISPNRSNSNLGNKNKCRKLGLRAFCNGCEKRFDLYWIEKRKRLFYLYKVRCQYYKTTRAWNQWPNYCNKIQAKSLKPLFWNQNKQLFEWIFPMRL